MSTLPPPEQLLREAVHLLPDAGRLVVGLVRDPRVPPRAKVEAAGLIALGLGPWDAVPVLGEMSAVAMTTMALRRLVRLAGEDVVREHWQGSDAGLNVLLALVASGLRPTRAAMRLLPRLARAVAARR
jgi:hypothetical protein